MVCAYTEIYRHHNGKLQVFIHLCIDLNLYIMIFVLQIIGCGDFKQLPPVPDPLHMDTGDYCFQTEAFDAAFPHRIHLTEVNVKRIKDI